MPWAFHTITGSLSLDFNLSAWQPCAFRYVKTKEEEFSPTSIVGKSQQLDWENPTLAENGFMKPVLGQRTVERDTGMALAS